MIAGIRACLIVVKGRRPNAKEEEEQRDHWGDRTELGVGKMVRGRKEGRKEGKATLVKREGDKAFLPREERGEMRTGKTDD